MIDSGIYSLSEVAHFTRVPAATIRSWFKLRSDGAGRGPLLRSDYETLGDEFSVSFLNLIDAYVASFFRAKGVKPSLIRRAYELMQFELRTPHPFAHEDLATDGERIIRARDTQLIDAVSKQMLFGEMRRHLSRIQYDRVTRLAETWRIEEGVIIDPGINFGKPVIEKAGISTLIVANQYLANGENAQLVARLFNITQAGVMNAYQFERRCGRLAA